MIRIIFNKIIPFFLYYYEKHIMFRIKMSWGIANLKRVKNIGVNVKVMGYTRFLDPNNIRIGNNVRIGYGCFFYGKGGITIGNNTIISRYVTIYSSNHNYKSDMIPYDYNYIHKSVSIGEGVWIGMGVSITPGVKIGNGAIIGMGAVISKDVEDGEIVVGNTQKIIGKRNMEEFYKSIKKDLIYSVHYPNS